MKQTIELVISPNGETRLQTRGFARSSCRQASQFLEEALGAKSEEKLTEEFYHQSAQLQQLNQEGGLP